MLALSPSHWSKADLMAPVFRCPGHCVQSHYERTEELFLSLRCSFSCQSLRWDVQRHFFCVITVKTLLCSHFSNLTVHLGTYTFKNHVHTHTHTRARVPSWHWLKEWFIDWGAAFLNNLQLSAAKVNANLWTAAIMLQSTRVCFTSCEGVLNLRATGTLVHGLFPCCLGNNGAGRKMSILAILWALSCVESERAVRVCGPWRESDEWCFIPDDYLLCVTQLWVRGPLSCSSEENWEKSTELLWIAKWDTLTAHVIVKYRLMGIIKLEHCLTQSFSWMLHKGEYQCCRVKTFQLQFWTSVEWLYFSICS